MEGLRQGRRSGHTRGCDVPDWAAVRAVRNTMDKKHLGTGLGLTIVKKILSQHDTKLRVSNRKTGGCQFAFELAETAVVATSTQAKILTFDPQSKGVQYGT